jgi:sortase A
MGDPAAVFMQLKAVFGRGLAAAKAGTDSGFRPAGTATRGLSVPFPWSGTGLGWPASRVAMVVAAMTALVGLALVGKGVAIYAKAIVAQILLERAFDQSLATGQPVKAWGWADTWPVARLEVPRLGVSTIVLKGGSGEALAFGPGLLDGTPAPGEAGSSVIAAHRDTQFSFLGDVHPGDEIRVTRGDGAIIWFRIADARVVRWDASGIDPRADGHWLVLSTCWPLGAATQGDLRYVVRAQMAGRQITSDPLAIDPL